LRVEPREERAQVFELASERVLELRLVGAYELVLDVFDVTSEVGA
jgi:hypothetical protein